MLSLPLLFFLLFPPLPTGSSADLHLCSSEPPFTSLPPSPQLLRPLCSSSSPFLFLFLLLNMTATSLPLALRPFSSPKSDRLHHPSPQPSALSVSLLPPKLDHPSSTPPPNPLPHLILFLHPPPSLFHQNQTACPLTTPLPSFSPHLFPPNVIALTTPPPSPLPPLLLFLSPNSIVPAPPPPPSPPLLFLPLPPLLFLFLSSNLIFPLPPPPLIPLPPLLLFLPLHYLCSTKIRSLAPSLKSSIPLLLFHPLRPLCSPQLDHPPLHHPLPQSSALFAPLLPPNLTAPSPPPLPSPPPPLFPSKPDRSLPLPLPPDLCPLYSSPSLRHSSPQLPSSSFSSSSFSLFAFIIRLNPI